jgi:heavy metal sensor kinase
MFHSFRLRVAVLSALLSGIALAGFGLFAWWVVYDIKVNQIKLDVVSYAERESRRRQPPDFWQHFESQILPSTLGVRNPQHLLLLVQDGAGNEIYRSAHWSNQLDSTQFHWQSFPQASEQESFHPPPPDAPPFDAPRPDAPPQNGEHPPFGERPPLGEHAAPPRPLRSAASLLTLKNHETTWHIGLASSPRGRVAIAVNVATIQKDMAVIRNSFLWAMPMALILIGLGAWFISGRALRPVNRLVESVRNVTAQGLHQRVPPIREAREFEALVLGFNAMLERLETSFHQASRFSADAAHELNTPLTILQGQIEHAMNQAEAGSPIQTSLGIILDEVRRLSSILRKLLLLSKADAGKLRLKLTPFDLSSALLELIEDTQMLAPTLNVTGDIPPHLTIDADEELFRQVLLNLMSNAIKYNIPDGWIHFSVLSTPQQHTLIVANASAGIPVEATHKIFERFYRVDAAHSRQVEGVGLGLSLSREIARAHGGELSLTVHPNHEVRLALVIPIVQTTQTRRIGI